MKKNLFCVVLGICYIDFCIHSVWIDIVLNKETRNTKVWFSIPSVQFGSVKAFLSQIKKNLLYKCYTDYIGRFDMLNSLRDHYSRSIPNKITVPITFLESHI